MSGKNAKNPVLVIGGATASGKSQLALFLAAEHNGVIINGDSMQVYRGLPILSAAPTAEDYAAAPHRLYEIYEPSVSGTVVDWLTKATEEIRRAWANGQLPIVAGGTGFYLDNLINGTTPIPEPDEAVRARAALIIEHEGTEGLYERLTKLDPEGAKLVNANDITRVRRAYEVKTQTGISIAQWYEKPMVQKLPEAEFVAVKLIPAKEELDFRCNLRFEQMMALGALKEVRDLLELNLNRDLPAMKMLGVPELTEFLIGRCSLEEAKEAAKTHTRQYAKRQRTWFRNRLEAMVILEHCFEPSSAEGVCAISKITQLITKGE